MRWHEWRAKLEQKANRPFPETQAPAGLTAAQSARLLRTLQRFQLGESGEGRVAHEIDSVTWPGVDADLRALVKLWVREEGRHARILGLMVKDLGGSLLRRHWSTRAFELARRAFGVRFKLLVALAAEVAGTVVYGLLARALPRGPLAAALSELEGDEQAHLEFQSELFAMFSRSRAAHALIQTGWFVLGAGVSAAVWWEHAGALEALGVTRLRTAAELGRCVLDVAERISRARPRAPAAARAVA